MGKVNLLFAVKGDTKQGKRAVLDFYKEIKSAAKGSKKDLAALQTAASAGGLAALTGIALALDHASKTTVDYVKNVRSVQRATKANAQESSLMAAILERIGVDGTQAGMMWTKFSKAIVDNKGALVKNGIAVEDAQGKHRGFLPILRDVAEKFARTEDAATRNKMASDLFGRGWLKLTPILAGGAKGIDDLAVKIREMGLELNQNTIDEVSKLIIAEKDLTQAQRGLEVQWGRIAIPLKLQYTQSLIGATKWTANLNRETKESLVRAGLVGGGTLALTKFAGAWTLVAVEVGSALNILRSAPGIFREAGDYGTVLGADGIQLADAFNITRFSFQNAASAATLGIVPSWRRAAVASGQLATAEQRQVGALNAVRAATYRVRDSQKAATLAGYDYKEAVWAQRDALKEWKTAIAEHGRKSREAQQAEINYRRSVIQTKDTYTASGKAQRLATRRSKEAAESQGKLKKETDKSKTSIVKAGVSITTTGTKAVKAGTGFDTMKKKGVSAGTAIKTAFSGVKSVIDDVYSALGMPTSKVRAGVSDASSPALPPRGVYASSTVPAVRQIWKSLGFNSDREIAGFRGIVRRAGGALGARYGWGHAERDINDCSGFPSYAIGIGRHTSGSWPAATLPGWGPVMVKGYPGDPGHAWWEVSLGRRLMWQLEQNGIAHVNRSPRGGEQYARHVRLSSVPIGDYPSFTKKPGLMMSRVPEIHVPIAQLQGIQAKAGPTNYYEGDTFYFAPGTSASDMAEIQGMIEDSYESRVSSRRLPRMGN